MSPEALERLLNFEKGIVQFVFPDDLRALLDAYAALETDRDEALAAGRTVVEAADEMRQQWAEIEEQLTEERDTARAEGVAAERARVVALVRAEAKALREMRFCACGCEMPLAEALKERKNGYLNDEQAESLMSVRIGSARTNAEAAMLERAADRIERGEHDKEGE